LSQPEERRTFEADITRFNQLFPGYLARPGDNFNFEEYYAKWEIENNKPSRGDASLIEKMKADLLSA
jgi:hypothetical protein